MFRKRAAASMADFMGRGHFFCLPVKRVVVGLAKLRRREEPGSLDYDNDKDDEEEASVWPGPLNGSAAHVNHFDPLVLGDSKGCCPHFDSILKSS